MNAQQTITNTSQTTTTTNITTTYTPRHHDRMWILTGPDGPGYDAGGAASC